MCASAARRTASPAPIATMALVAAVPTLWPTIIAQACSKVSDPVCTATSVVAAANGIKVPRNAFHPGLQVVDADKEQPKPGQNGSGRTGFAVGDQPQKGTDTDHWQGKGGNPQAKAEYRHQPWRRGCAESGANDDPHRLREGDQSGADEADDGQRRRG